MKVSIEVQTSAEPELDYSTGLPTVATVLFPIWLMAFNSSTDLNAARSLQGGREAAGISPGVYSLRACRLFKSLTITSSLVLETHKAAEGVHCHPPSRDHLPLHPPAEARCWQPDVS